MIATFLKALISFTIVVIAVMLAARLVGAGRKDFRAASISVILQFVLVATLIAILPATAIPSNSPMLILAIIGGSIIHSTTLKTTLPKGFLIGVASIFGVAILQFTILGGVYVASRVAT